MNRQPRSLRRPTSDQLSNFRRAPLTLWRKPLTEQLGTVMYEWRRIQRRAGRDDRGIYGVSF